MDEDPAAPSPKRGAEPPPSPQFLAHVRCGQVAGWIKMPIGMQVNIGPSDIVSDGDPAHTPQKGAIFGPCLLSPNGWMDQDKTWHAGQPWPWPHCVRWGPISLSSKGAQPLIIGPYLLRPNGWMDRDLITRFTTIHENILSLLVWLIFGIVCLILLLMLILFVCSKHV